MDKNVKIMVFTPTYNRGYCIENLYQSLVGQTYKDFEWMVIDDGSTDNTEEIFQRLMQENKIKIIYIKQKNGGQHRALNKAIEQSTSEILMIVDSDDDLTPDALYWIDYYENTIKDKTQYAGVSGLRRYRRDGGIVGTFYSKKNVEYIDATNLERFKYNILLRDKAEAYYTNVLKKYYPIPEFAEENDVEKGVLWNRIAADNLKIRWFNKGIYNCEYLPDGMTRNTEKNYLKNYNGYTLYTKEFIHYDISFYQKLKAVVHYCEIARKKKINVKMIAYDLSISYMIAFIAYLESYMLNPLRITIGPIRRKIKNFKRYMGR